MAADGLVENILNATRERGEQLLEEAQASFDGQFADGLAQVESEAQERRAAGTRAAEDGLRQRLSGARLAENKQLVSLRRRLVDQLYANAWKQLTSGDGYRAYLEQELREHAQSGDQLIVSQLERDRFNGELQGMLGEHGVSLAEESGRFRAGFVIARGEERLNCTLDQTFVLLQEDTEIEVSGLLFQAG